ncbi:MAG: hypothetical protein HY548_08495 [Elusimicrobia bacterium]|nr:hypothetical protein [Elusimicrobiota bacterium]
MTSLTAQQEKLAGAVIAEKLRTPLNSENPGMRKRFLQGGYRQDGYGVENGAAVDGSHAFEGTQGYYTPAGKDVFLNTVAGMRRFFERRAERLGKPIRVVVKTGIGGQHTPFQGIASVFEVMGSSDGRVLGEYELGKDYRAAFSQAVRELGIDWDQIAVIPSSKSGSTDETMLIFTSLLRVLLSKLAQKRGLEGSVFAKVVLNTLHEVNFLESRERPAQDLFKAPGGTLLDLIARRVHEKGLNAERAEVKEIFGRILGNMFFETTDRPDQSRLSAFIRNSGLDEELAEDAPGFSAMFDNVGGRWTADLHMMAFLAYHKLDAAGYWEARRRGIESVRNGAHEGNRIAHRILDAGVADIALLVPDEFFWWGKSIEQNFNESIWQEGFANLVTVKASHWDAQKSLYAKRPARLVINMAGSAVSPEVFQVEIVEAPSRSRGPQAFVEGMADLTTTFYGMTNTAGARLIARALAKAGHAPKDVDMNDLDNPATRIVQENLFLRQPYVELGKGLLEKRLKELQEKEAQSPGALQAAVDAAIEKAWGGEVLSNVPALKNVSHANDKAALSEVLRHAAEYARVEGRKLVPFLYLEGEKFHRLRDELTKMGVEWVMQGTGDQHISYQQVLSRPQKYLPLIISFVPEAPLDGDPAVGFAKGYLHRVSAHLVRDFFAEASYTALTDLRSKEGGRGVFVRLFDTNKNLQIFEEAARGNLFQQG